MVASPKKQDVLSMLAEVKQSLIALGNKTFFSIVIGSGGITVKGGGGITVAGGNLSLADPAGDELLQNDQIAGWGLTSPNMAMGIFPAPATTSSGLASPASFTAKIDGNYYTNARGGVPINHPKIRFGIGYTSTAGASGAWRVQWYTSIPGAAIPNPTGGTLMASGIIALGTSARVDASYRWPSNMYGQIIYLSFEAEISTGTPGTDFVSAYPTYCYGTGVNGA